MSKKGALELGVSTVVVLVIAIVLIGVVIAFVTGLGDNLTENVDSIPTNLLPVQPSPAEPLAISKDELSVKGDESKTLEVGIYNTQTSGLEGVKIVSQQCTKEAEMVIDSLPQDIKSGEKAGYKIQISAGEDTGAGTYICNVVAIDNSDAIYAQKDITFIVEV